MKNIAIFTFLFAFLLGGFSASSYGQQAITEKDVRDRVTAAKAQLKSLAFRQEKIIERFEDKNKIPSQRTEFTAIFLPPDSIHTVLVSQGRSGHIRTETIAIGKTKYTKVNEGDWLRETRDNYSIDTKEYGRWGEPNPKIETLVEKRGKETKNGISSDLYVITNKYTYADSITTIIEQYWFDEKGLLIREESSDSETGKSNNLRRAIANFKYDPKIKIVAPIP